MFRKANYNNSEQLIKRAICDYLQRLPECVPLMYPSYRGTVRGDGTRVVTRSIYMPPGVSDILACWRGLFLAIEVKRPRGKQRTMLGVPVQSKGVLSQFQEVFLDRVRRARGIAIVAYSVDDVANALNELDPKILHTKKGE